MQDPQRLFYLMHPGHSRLDLGLNQPLELLAQEVLHGDLVGLHLLQIFQQSAPADEPGMPMTPL